MWSMDEVKKSEPTTSKSTPASNSNSNPKQSEVATKIREEGELSVSEDDDDENPVCSAEQSAGTVSLAPIGSIPVTSLNKINNQGVQAGKDVSSASPASSFDAQPRAPIQSNNDKNFEKNRASLNSANAGWHVPSGANNNLVIRFSDDDSSSDSEDSGREKASETKRDMTVVDDNRRLPLLPSVNSSKLQRTTRNVNKVIPKKPSASRAFVSSMTKTNGGANSRTAGPSLVEHGSRVRNISATTRHFASQEHGLDQGMGLTNTKLQDLRQQIALRERELKLKNAQQNKESVPVSGRSLNTVNLSDASRKSGTTSADIEPKEPERKRLKVSGPYSARLNLDVRQGIPAAKSILPSKKKASDGSHLEDGDIVDQSKIRSSTRRTESNMVKWQKQDDKQGMILSENLGANINGNCSQFNRSSMELDPSVVSNQTAPITNVDSTILPKNTKTVQLNHPINISGHRAPSSFLKTSTSEQNLRNNCEYPEDMSGEKTLDQSLNNTSQASLTNASFWNYLGTVNVSDHSNISILSLIEMEESFDKELEEAQEYRRRCEIEERNALKAYRKAQRTLIEANARCSDLYQKRELYSSQIRCLFMNDSRLWSSRQQEHVGIGLNSTNNVSRNQELVPASNHQIHSDMGYKQPGYNSNVNVASTKTSYQHVNGQYLGFEQCSELGASMSEPLVHDIRNAVNGLHSPSNDRSVSADEDEEMFSLDHENAEPNLESERRGKDCIGSQKDRDLPPNCHPKKDFFVDGSQDSLVLEASLRSELFERLGVRNLSKKNVSSNTEPTNEQGTAIDNGSDKTQISNESEKTQLSNASDKTQISNVSGKPQISNGSEKIHSNESKKTQTSNGGFPFLEAGKDQENDVGGHQLTTSIVVSPPLVLRSAFAFIEAIAPVTLLGSQAVESHKDNMHDHNECDACSKIKCTSEEANSVVQGIGDITEKENGSFMCNLAVDAFWPLCMYELRGKCNNDECPWQHVRDFSSGNAYQHQHVDSDSDDCQAGFTLPRKQCNGGMRLSCHILTPPIYLVGLDILKAFPHSNESIGACRHGQWWQKCFSRCLGSSSLLQKDLPEDGPFMSGSAGRIEVNGSLSRQLSYFQRRSKTMNNFNQALHSIEQSLEMALLILSQGVSKLEGTKKALSLLSRALETDRKSEILWITYLLIYHGNFHSERMPDMFFHAVENNNRSYGLWLMYINSRTHLDDRLNAYDGALKALCHQASGSDRDKMHVSACILDLFLQMMDCLCMSGNVENAILKICGLFPVTTNSDEPHSLLLSDILTCLTISDKYVFWVCCVYLVIYRKLPDAIVERFEHEKELLPIEWPAVHLIDEQKQRAAKLVKMAVDSVNLFVNSGSVETGSNLMKAQHFAVCHVRCVVALDGLASSLNLLEKYLKLFPSCLELTLISARVQMNNFEGSGFEGFEDALRNWPKEALGIQCIWNQYIECALQRRGPDFAKGLIIHWFNSISRVKYPLNEAAIGTSSSNESLEMASTSYLDTLIPSSNQVDVMFGYLNFSLAKLLANDHVSACIAMDRAFKIAPPEYLKHCLKEHATFSLAYESQLKKDASVNDQLDILKGYLEDPRSAPTSQPLSRQFMNNIEKPRNQQLISNMLSPISADFSLVNLALEAWYGPSMLPKKLTQPKHLVDFVEAVLEIVPSNYPLAFSVCKLLLSRDFNSGYGTSSSILYWASTTLINAIFHAMPIAPEYKWVEAASLLGNITDIETISERFYKRALSIYPFSTKLWSCYYNLSKMMGGTNSILEVALKKGIQLA